MTALSHTPFTWRTPSGALRLTVACKATYPLAPGLVAPLATPEPIWHPDLHANNAPEAALLYPSDLVPYKARADVLLIGAAYARPGSDAVSIRARLRLGAIDKSIFVFAERFQGEEGRIRVGPLTPHVVLGAERCINDAENPVGVVLPHPGRIGVLPTTVAADPRKVKDSLAAHLGPIARAWPTRRKLLPAGVAPFDIAEVGTLPKDVSAGYFNAAPPDQQLDELPDVLVVQLESLHPDHPVLETRLARVAPEVRMTRPLGPKTTMTCDTVVVDTARLAIHVTWRATLVMKSEVVPSYEVRDAAPDEPHDAGDRTTPMLGE